MDKMDKIKRKLKKAKEDVLGQSYDYGDHIPTPQALGVSADGNLFALVDDIKASMKYTNMMVLGNDPHPLGNNFFIKSGKCNNDEQGKSCKNNMLKCADRYIYVRNIPTGEIPGMKWAGDTGLKGLVPGFLQDVEDLTTVPKRIIDNLSGKGSKPPNKCKQVTRWVGPSGKMWKETRWSPVVEPFSIKTEQFLLGFIILLMIIVFIR